LTEVIIDWIISFKLTYRCLPLF